MTRLHSRWLAYLTAMPPDFSTERIINIELSPQWLVLKNIFPNISAILFSAMPQ